MENISRRTEESLPFVPLRGIGGILLKHIETPEVKRLYPNDSINPLKYYDYVPIQKKDSLRREYLA